MQSISYELICKNPECKAKSSANEMTINSMLRANCTVCGKAKYKINGDPAIDRAD